MNTLFFDKVSELVIKTIQDELKKNNSIASGELYKNISTNVINTDTLQVEMEDYANYVDEGTRPHFPPIEPIKRWINQKNLNLNAYAVARNISKYGTAPHPFLYILDELNIDNFYYEYIEDELDRIILNNKKFKI